MSEKVGELIAQSIKEMLEWEIEHTQKMPHGTFVTIRSGDLMGTKWFAVILEAQVENERHLLDIPPQSEWGEYAMMSIQVDGRGLIIWTYETTEKMIPDLIRLFGMFSGIDNSE